MALVLPAKDDRLVQGEPGLGPAQRVGFKGTIDESPGDGRRRGDGEVEGRARCASVGIDAVTRVPRRAGPT